jgi:hypothetical protein
LTENQWRWEFLRRCEAYQAAFESYGHDQDSAGYLSGCKDFAVTGLCDPATPKVPINLLNFRHPYEVRFASKEKFAQMRKQHVRLMAFDLNRPLRPQFEKARQYLEILQSGIGKPAEQRSHRSKWARYLRVLDAKAANAKASDIARVLNLQPSGRSMGFDPDRLVSENLEQAKAVQLRFKQSA